MSKYFAGNRTSPVSYNFQFNQMEIKCLQEAMYHSIENNNLDITIQIRSLGIPWTLYCWINSLRAAHSTKQDSIIDQLLQDFLHICQDNFSTEFVQECLPLLFCIFKHNKVSLKIFFC